MAAFTIALPVVASLCTAISGTNETPASAPIGLKTTSPGQRKVTGRTRTSSRHTPFTRNTEDRVTGQSSIQVRMQVGEERPNDVSSCDCRFRSLWTCPRPRPSNCG